MRASKLRSAVFLLAMGIMALGFASTAQAGAGDAFTLVVQNLDPVFFIILGCSIAGVTFIVQGFIRTRRSVVMPEASINHMRELIGQRQFKELIDFTETEPSFVSRALNPALKRAPSFSSMKEAMETAVGEQTAEAFRKIEYLNILGNLGPLLGLLGTVIGMIDSFTALQNYTGKDQSKMLSGGISKALCHTMLGLVLAVPCLACFGILRTMVDRLTTQAALISEELLLMIKPAEAKPAATAALGAGARPAAMPHPAAPAVAPAIRRVPMAPPAPVQG